MFYAGIRVFRIMFLTYMVQYKPTYSTYVISHTSDFMYYEKNGFILTGSSES